MSNLHTSIDKFSFPANVAKAEVVAHIKDLLELSSYNIVELNDQKPWGAYFRLDNSQATMFINEFFSGLTIEEARLGIENAELSPKILIVEPGHRLSWQYHDRRAERWTFLTDGMYEKSFTDEENQPVFAHTGEVVQFEKAERHRLLGAKSVYTVVAEIWQHTDIDNLSNEDDIVRLADDYQR